MILALSFIPVFWYPWESRGERLSPSGGGLAPTLTRPTICDLLLSTCANVEEKSLCEMCSLPSAFCLRERLPWTRAAPCAEAGLPCEVAVPSCSLCASRISSLSLRCFWWNAVPYPAHKSPSTAGTVFLLLGGAVRLTKPELRSPSWRLGDRLLHSSLRQLRLGKIQHQRATAPGGEHSITPTPQSRSNHTPPL